ncbi:MAG TPA: DUF5714 domain-containing protein, partial [Vicinamibacterales bacterium]|nr:DUF5714 domain-containing protein [Vicinamibacterales bacterium]
TLLKRYPYRTVAGHPFYSVTYRAERPRPVEEVRSVYRGPYAAVITDEGLVLRRGIPAVAPPPPTAPADQVFVLDAEGGVANIDMGGACACFVPPALPAAGVRPAAPRPVKITDHEGCMVCAAPLEYLETSAPARCHFCGRSLATSARCARGHFVCDECHAEDAIDLIRTACAATTETDMVALVQRLRAHPAVPLHGPEHHALVPAVIVAAARNAGMRLDDGHLETAIARGRTIAGGACGLMGACGAAIGAGVGFAVILGSNPYLGDRRQAVQQLVGRALARVAAFDAARCCQRDCWLALQEASASSEDLLGVHLPAVAPLTCGQVASNGECLGAACPLAPRRRPRADRRLLPMM